MHANTVYGCVAVCAAASSRTVSHLPRCHGTQFIGGFPPCLSPQHLSLTPRWQEKESEEKVEKFNSKPDQLSSGVQQMDRL